LNQYSESESSHFHHIINLLEEISKEEVRIVLIIEKPIDVPRFNSKNISVMLQKKSGLGRFFELLGMLRRLNKSGFKKVFVRISQNGAIPAILISKIFGGSVYYWQSGTGHRLDAKKRFNMKRYIKSELPFNIVKRYVNYFVTGPESMLEYYEQVVGVKKNKLICLYNDIDLDRFSSIDDKEKSILKNELGIEKNKKIILFVHRLSPVRKSLFYMPYVLKNILQNNNQYICYIIGGGSEEEELIELIKTENLENKIFVLGQKQNNDIQKFYQVSDIFINPTYTEGFPRVLIEAMASGLPTVTTNAGGTVDIVGEIQTRFMVDIQDRDGFSAKLKELIEDETTQKELGLENQNFVKKFSTQNVAKMYIRELFKND